MKTKAWQCAVLLVSGLCFLAAGSAAQGTHTVQQTSNFFEPYMLHIEAGDRIVWLHGGGFHTVTEGVGPQPTGGEAFDMPLDYDHQYASLLIDDAFLCSNPRVNNIYAYYCQVHGVHMKGLIVVHSAWRSIDSALDGVAGAPRLCGFGTLEAGTALRIELTSGAPRTQGVIFVGLELDPRPFYGGTLLPWPPFASIAIGLDANGSYTTLAPVGAGLSGAVVGLQAALLDAAAVQGVSLSNTLVANFP